MKRLAVVLAVAVLVGAGAFGAKPRKGGKTKPAVAAPSADSVLMRVSGLVAEYRLDEAGQLLDGLEERRGSKGAEAGAVDSLRSYIVDLRNMLERVEKLDLLEVAAVPAQNFVLRYPLSPDTGRLTLGTGRDSDRATMAFIPAGEREIFWTALDKQGRSQIYTASILDDGTIDAPRRLDLLPDHEVAYPYLMADGESMYFAAKGPTSIGGYDLYLTRRQADGSFTTPQNLGMPYNSPQDDYMLAVDETTGNGYWASTRDGVPGQLTVFAYRPKPARVNYPSETPELIALARLSDVPRKTDSALFTPRTAAASRGGGGQSAALFRIAVNGKVYTDLNDFQNPDARTAMTALLGAQREYEQLDARLAEARRDYRAGRHDLRGDILAMEKRRSALAAELRQHRNRVVQLER